SFVHGYGGASGSGQQYPQPPPPPMSQEPQGYEYYSHPSIMRSPTQSQCNVSGLGAMERDVPNTAQSLYSAAAAAMDRHSGARNYHEKQPAHSIYSQDTGYTGLTRDTFSECASRPIEHSVSYSEAQPRERGIKTYFMKTRVDEFGASHESVSKSKFAMALAVGGAAAFAAKRGFDRHRNNRMQMMHPGSPCMSGSMVGSQYGCSSYGGHH
ncbi:hypothetical protein LPJ61_006592, partial [Coemansia biformis]